jgi:hypothetical protein
MTKQSTMRSMCAIFFLDAFLFRTLFFLVVVVVVVVVVLASVFFPIICVLYSWMGQSCTILKFCHGSELGFEGGKSNDAYMVGGHDSLGAWECQRRKRHDFW